MWCSCQGMQPCSYCHHHRCSHFRILWEQQCRAYALDEEICNWTPSGTSPLSSSVCKPWRSSQNRLTGLELQKSIGRQSEGQPAPFRRTGCHLQLLKKDLKG